MAFGKKAKDQYKLLKEAKRAKKELKNLHIEAEHKGVTVVVSAEQKVIDIQIDPTVPGDKIPEFLKEALNRALDKAQIVAAEKMQGVMGEMGLGGAQ